MRTISPRRRKRVQHAHPMVAEAAKAIIMESYDALMHHDANWHFWQLQHPGFSKKRLEEAYVEYNWGKAVVAARESLAMCLDKAKAPSLSEQQRVEIHEALVLDASLRMGRKMSAYVN